MDKDIAIRVDKVYKDFRLPHEKNSTVKSIFTNIMHYIRNAKTYDIQHALQDISFEVKKGEFFGIVGRNGSGKSTLLKILASIYQPNNGSVKVNGRLVPFIELGVGFNGELTGRENIYLNGSLLGFSKEEIDDLYQEIVDFAELEQFMDQKLKNYSSGMQVRLAFSLAVRADADILLVDEVLAVGDANFQRKCFDYFRKLKKEHKTVVFVSHDMSSVREYCDRAILIDKSKKVLEDNATKVATAYTKMFADEMNDQDKSNANSKRWGDQSIKFTKIEVEPKVLRDSDKNLKLHLVAEANETVTKPIFGFLVKTASGTQLLGTNSQIRKQEVSILKKGKTISITWTIPNVFADGEHFIDPAVVYHGGTVVCDWWEEAAKFTCVREERTPYVISPHIGLELKEL